MKIGEILYFAPRIRFSEVDLDAAAFPEQFKCRMLGFYVEPAERCALDGHAFAAGLLLVSCIDALARFRFGDGVGIRFQRFAREELESFSSADLSDRFYDEFRNGVVHEGRLKNGAQLGFDIERTVEEFEGILLVNPNCLAREVRSALNAYVALIKRDPRERQNLIGILAQDLASDLRLSSTGR